METKTHRHRPVATSGLPRLSHERMLVAAADGRSDPVPSGLVQG
jgi:hypothetical protein